MISDGYNVNSSNRDIFLKLHDRDLQKILELHLLYNIFYYILLFLRGNDDWHAKIPLIEVVKRKKITIIQFYSYRLQIRDGD